MLISHVCAFLTATSHGLDHQPEKQAPCPFVPAVCFVSGCVPFASKQEACKGVCGPCPPVTPPPATAPGATPSSPDIPRALVRDTLPPSSPTAFRSPPPTPTAPAGRARRHHGLASRWCDCPPSRAGCPVMCPGEVAVDKQPQAEKGPWLGVPWLCVRRAWGGFQAVPHGAMWPQARGSASLSGEP